jgi:hypothetical protein
MTKRATSRKSGKLSTKRGAKKAAARKAKAREAKPESPSPPGYTVFISHSSKERWIARQMAKEIESLGAETWLDLKDLRGGDEIRSSVKSGIKKSREAVILLSANSITSQWVSYEAGIADGQDKRVTSILNNLSPDEGLKPLEGIKALDLNDFDLFLVELEGRIKEYLAEQGKAAL